MWSLNQTAGMPELFCLRLLALLKEGREASMPVIVNSKAQHPFLPSLGSPQAIESKRALHQDIRPLEIAIINLMANKQATERQLAFWLGHSPLQVNLTFATTDSYIEEIRTGKRAPKNTPKKHIVDFYSPFGAIRDRKFDGLLLTGVNAQESRVEKESFWPAIAEILDWSKSHVLSSLFLCWGAKAALKHFHDIDSVKGRRKLHGLFPHQVRVDRTGLLADFPDVFPLPVSRWKSPDAKKIAATKGLDIVASSQKAGANILVEPAIYNKEKGLFARRLYLLCHPEYETDTLATEFERDRERNPRATVPYGYYPKNDPSRPPANSWRYTGNIYTSWIQQLYQAAPFDRAAIPKPF